MWWLALSLGLLGVMALVSVVFILLVSWDDDSSTLGD